MSKGNEVWTKNGQERMREVFAEVVETVHDATFIQISVEADTYESRPSETGWRSFKKTGWHTATVKWFVEPDDG